MMNIPTVTSCWIFDLKMASLCLGSLDIAFSVINIVTAFTNNVWGVPFAVLIALAHIVFVYGIRENEPSLMIPGLILNSIILLLISACLVILPVCALVMLTQLNGLWYAAVLMVAFFAAVKLLLVHAYFFVVKYSLYRSMKDNSNQYSANNDDTNA